MKRWSFKCTKGFFALFVTRENISLGTAVIIVFAIAIGMYYNVDDAVNTVATIGLESEINSNAAVGQLYLSAAGVDASNPVSILINGMVSGYLDSDTKVLDIRNGNVVELDARGLAVPVCVTIIGKSDNVAGECVGRSVTVDNGIHNFGTFAINR